MEVSTVSPKAWGWFLAYGVLLVLLGLFAISAATFTTLVSVVFLGALLLIGGIILFVDSFHAQSFKSSSFYLKLIVGLLYIITGILLASHPVTGAVTLTLFLSVLFIVVGILRILGSVTLRSFHWGWSLFSGILTLVLGLLILMHWPASSLLVIGIFVGIDLLFIGWTYILVSLAAKSSGAPRLS